MLDSDRNITPLLKDREDLEEDAPYLKYTNIVEIFYAVLKHKNFLYYERSLKDESIGLSIYEFIDFTILLGIYRWRTTNEFHDIPATEAISKTLERVLTYA